jgi:IS605 OrfB family transposase
VLHRPIKGTIKTCTVRRSSTGKWYACFSVEYDPSPLPQKETTVGIAVGLESFATLSNGEKIENPRFFRTDEKALAKAQRRLSKAEKGTPGKIVAHIHERIANRRLNFAHPTSHQLMDRFGTIVFEDLNIIKMEKNHHLAKSIADVAWNLFITITESKAEDAGSRVIRVNCQEGSFGTFRAQEHISAMLQMWNDCRKDPLGSCPFLPVLWARHGSRPECGDQYSEIGACNLRGDTPGCPRREEGEQSPSRI